MSKSRSTRQVRIVAPRVEPAPEVWEALWRVVDAARWATRPMHDQTREDALAFLADQEKMLCRAVAFFHAPLPDGESALRVGTKKHPYILELEEKNLKWVEDQLMELARNRIEGPPGSRR